MSSRSNSEDWKNSWELFSTRVGNAFSKSVLFWTFIVGVIGVSSSGIWLPYAFDDKVTVFLRPDALLTYCIALLSSIVIDFLLDNDFGFDSKSLSIITFGIILLSIFLLAYYYVHNQKVWCGIVGTLLTLALWLFCNANNPKYDEVSKSASIGGQVASKGGLGNG
jgi:hypothetical protein